MIRDEVVKRALDALKQVTVWLGALLDGTIEFVDDVADAAEWIGYELRETFKTVGKEAAIALKKAGYEFNKAYIILDKAQEVALRKVMDVMCDAAAYAEREVIEWFEAVAKLDKPEYTARMVGELLLDNGMPSKRVIEEIHKLVKDVPLAAEVLGQLERPIFEVVDFLQDTRTNATKAAELLVRAFFDINKQVVTESLKLGGYAVNEATQAAENVFREAGRFAENIRDEVRRTWERYKPEITIRW
jgi:hypothetical protein